MKKETIDSNCFVEWSEPEKRDCDIMYKGVYLAGHDLLVDLDGLVGEERRVAGRHLVHEHAERPPVDRLVVTLCEASNARKL